MKRTILLCLVSQTLVAAPANLRVTPRDANSSEVAWTEGPTSHSYVSVGTGLNYRDQSGAWRESQDLIELLPDGSAVAMRGPHKVRFSANLNTAGVISLTTVSNRVLRSHPLALYYLNAQTGERALVAQIKDSIGEFHPPNQLVYRDCLEGAKADYRLTYTKSGMEADLVILEQLPPPEAFFGTNRSVRLEWVTEFLDPPTPQIRTRVLKEQTDPALRQSMAEPDLIDDTLDFGDAWFPLGRAFEWDAATRSDPTTPAEIRVFNPANETNHVSVAKRWQRMDQRAVLVESVDWSDIAPKLDSLPPSGRVASASELKERVSKGRRLPERMLAMQLDLDETIKLASLPYQVNGYVLDYITVIGGTSFTFASGVTHYISSSASFSGTVTFQPNCIIKFANSAYLLMYGPIVCNGTASLPSILTSKDDDLFGESILYSTGHPAYAASQAMWVYYVDFNTQIQYARIRWAQTGIQYDANPAVTVTHTLQNCSFQQCLTGVYANLPDATLNLSSVIKCGVTTPISCPGSCNKINGSMIEDCAGDTDSDGLPDSWETQKLGTLIYNGVDDPDNDGLTNLQEYQGGTNPNASECPRAIYETAISGQSPSPIAWFQLNDGSLADVRGGQALGNPNSAVSFTSDLFDKVNGAVEFDNNADVLTAGDLINGGAPAAPSVDQTVAGSVSFLFRTLGDLTASKRYLLSQGTSTTGSKNAFHVYFDNAQGGQHLTLEIGDTKTAILLASPVNQIVPDTWYYLAITWKHDRNPEVFWYLGRVGGSLVSGTIDLEDSLVHAVVGDNGSLFLGNKSGGGGAFQETIPPMTGTPYKGRLDQVAFWNSELTPSQIAAQFNALPPAGLSANFDLTHWELMLPVNNAGNLVPNDPPHVVEHSQLNAGFKYLQSDCTKKYFYKDVNTMVFEAPWNGADTDTTGNSPRSELRERLANGNEHNWAPNSEGGTHIIEASCKVISGNSKVVIGQIHAKTPVPQGESDGVPAVILSYDPSTRVPTVTVKHSPTCPGDNCPDTDFDFVPLPPGDDTINYTLQMVGVGTSVTLNLTVNNETKPPIDMTQLPFDLAPAWANTTLYFKAGSYYPKNLGTGTAKVTFSSLSVSP